MVTVPRKRKGVEKMIIKQLEKGEGINIKNS